MGAQQRMQQQMEQMKPKANGMPVFNLYVRPRNGPWMQCGAMVGDEASKSLVEGWMSNSLGMGNMIKGNIDRSVATSVLESKNLANLKNQVSEQLPLLRSSKKNLQFGYT